MLKMGVFSPRQHNTNDKVVKIAREMRDVALCCRMLSSEEMKAKRLQLLENNKDATIEELIKAIEIKIDGYDIISLLKSLKCDVCDEYAASVEVDHGRGLLAINKGFGDTLMETVIYWRLL
jgi:hypothetical protein